MSSEARMGSSSPAARGPSTNAAANVSSTQNVSMSTTQNPTPAAPSHPSSYKITGDPLNTIQYHENLGSHTQILLIEKAMKIRFRPGVLLTQTWDEIDTITEKIKAIGPIDYDQLKTAFAIHALADHYSNLQSTVQAMTKQDKFTVSDVSKRITEEEDLIRNRDEQST